MLHVFMTGASGQVGAFVASQLLAQGYRLSLLVRGPDAHRRMAEIFSRIGVESQQWQVYPGDLFTLPALDTVDIVLHSAAELSFEAAHRDKIWHTNFDGTAALLEWSVALGARSFQYISTAYVAGQYPGRYHEHGLDYGQTFRNQYEASKLAGEKYCHAFCRAHGISLKIYRPGIIMGTSSGQSLHYKGYYIFLKVIDRLREKYRGRNLPEQGIGEREGRLQLPIRIEAQPQAKKHLVPLDYVAQGVAALLPQLDCPVETVFLLPEQVPTNQQTVEWVEQALGLRGLELVPPGTLSTGARNNLEKLVQRYIGIYAPYLQAEPNFHYDYSRERLAAAGVRCPAMGPGYFRQLIEYGRRDNWGQPALVTPDKAARHPYFCEFLPKFIDKPFLQGSISCRFAVCLHHDRCWWRLTLEQGILKIIEHLDPDNEIDFSYRLSDAVFTEIVAGKRDPRHAFFSGKTDISGDIELGLKVATVLRRFFSENPYLANT